MAQDSSFVIKGEIVSIVIDESLDASLLDISLSEGLGWHTTIIPIFNQRELSEKHFPKNPGIYNLMINYKDSLCYNEVILYRSKPTNEHLSFAFYREGARFFCQVKSQLAIEFNREIVLCPLPSDLQMFLDHLEESKEKHED